MHIIIMLNTLLLISLVAVTGSLAATDLAAAQDNMITNDDTIQQLINEQISTSGFSSSTADLSTEAPGPSLTIIRELRNATKEVGEGMRLRCEIKGSPPAKWIKWFM